MKHLTIAYASLLCWASLVTATATETEWTDMTAVSDRPTSSPSTTPIEDQLTSQGCYGSPSDTMKLEKGVSFVSSGSCYQACKGKNKPVMLLYATNCYCADTYPARDSMVDDSKCNYGCPGYVREACGGLGGFYNVFNTGLEVDGVEHDSSSKATQTSSASASASSGGSLKASDSSSRSSYTSVSDSSSAPTPTVQSSRASSTPSVSATGENSGVVSASSLVHVLAWIGLALAL